MNASTKHLCPSCGEYSVVRFVFGFPSDELFRAEERGEVLLGGCLPSTPDEPSQPVGRARFGWQGGLDLDGQPAEAEIAVLGDQILRTIAAAESETFVADSEFLHDEIADAIAVDGLDGRLVGWALWLRAETLYFSGTAGDAIDAIRAAMATDTDNGETGGKWATVLRARLAACLADLGRHDEALTIWEHVLPLVGTHFGADHTDTLEWRLSYGQSLSATGHHHTALDVLGDTLTRLRRHHSRDTERLDEAMRILADVERAAAITGSP